MDLIKLTFRLADGGTETRLATSAQDIAALEARYLESIPGAVFCLKTTVQRNVSPARAFWVYQATALNFQAAEFRRERDRGPGRYKLV